MINKKCFSVNISKHSKRYDFEVVRPSSIDKPKDNSVIFVTTKYINKIEGLSQKKECLVFVPKDYMPPKDLESKHCFIKCERPRLELCRFYEENNIRSLPESFEYEMVNNACIAKDAEIGMGSAIMPFAVIGPEVKLGKNSYIGYGVKLVCPIKAGDNLIIRDNAVIGADGLACERNFDGRNIKLPQFGGVTIGNNVEIGSSIIARGAIDDTIIGDNVIVDSYAYISHNCIIGDNCQICGNTSISGSVEVGKEVYISSSIILNKKKIGKGAFIGMGSVVLRNVKANTTVFGYPAKTIDI